MSQWHQFSYPGVAGPAFTIAHPSTDPVEANAPGLDVWRELPRAQTPPWPDQA